MLKKEYTEDEVDELLWMVENVTKPNINQGIIFHITIVNTFKNFYYNLHHGIYSRKY